MGKSFNATVDWLGMVENGGDLPSQDVDPSVNGGKAQTGVETSLINRREKRGRGLSLFMEPKGLEFAVRNMIGHGDEDMNASHDATIKLIKEQDWKNFQNAWPKLSEEERKEIKADWKVNHIGRSEIFSQFGTNLTDAEKFGYYEATNRYYDKFNHAINMYNMTKKQGSGWAKAGAWGHEAGNLVSGALASNPFLLESPGLFGTSGAPVTSGDSGTDMRNNYLGIAAANSGMSYEDFLKSLVEEGLYEEQYQGSVFDREWSDLKTDWFGEHKRQPLDLKQTGEEININAEYPTQADIDKFHALNAGNYRDAHLQNQGNALITQANVLTDNKVDMYRPDVSAYEHANPFKNCHYDNTCVEAVKKVYEWSGYESGIPEDVYDNAAFLENYKEYGYEKVDIKSVNDLIAGDVLQYYGDKNSLREISLMDNLLNRELPGFDAPYHMGVYVGNGKYFGDGSDKYPSDIRDVYIDSFSQEKDPFRVFRRIKPTKIKKAKYGGDLPKAQDGTETERDRFVKFIKDNEGGYDYIRAKDSAIKKMGEDGEWDGESYYKIFDEGTQKYYPYFLNDEKGATIGHGHHNNNVYEDYSEGISIAKAEELLNLDVDNKMSDTEIWWTSKYGDEEWGNLDESTQYLLGDYAYNTGHIRNYKLFADAIKRGDYETAIKEYKRKDDPGGSYLGRNETYLAEYLQPWIDAQKLNLPAPPLNEMPLPIGVFPTDGEGIEQPMTLNKTYMEGISPFDYQVPPAVQDNTRVGNNVFGGWKTGGELPNFKEGGSLPKYQSKGQYPAFIKTEREKKGYDQAMSRGWVYDTRLPLLTNQSGPSYFFTQDNLDIALEKAGINQTTHYDGRKLNDAGLLTLDQTQGDRMSFSYNKKNEYGRDLSHYVDSDENDRMMKLINTGNWGYNPSTGQMVELNKPTKKQLTATQHVMDTEEFGELTTGFGSSGNYNDEQQIIFDNLSKADQKIVKGLSKDQRKKWVANSMQEVYKNPITYAPGALFFGAFAGPSLLTAASTDLIGGIAGTSTLDALGYYGAYHGITHGPEDIKKAIDDPSVGNIFNVAMDFAGIGGGGLSTYRGLSNFTKSGKQYTSAYNELKNLNKTNIFKNTLAEGNLSNKQIKLLAENPNLKNNIIKTAIKNDPKITRYTNVDVKQALNSDVTRKALLADGVNIKNEKEVAEWLSTRIHVGGPDIGYRAGAGGSENYLFGDYKYTIPRSDILRTTPSKTKSGQGFTYNLDYGPWQTKMRVKGTEGLLDFTKGNSSDWIKRLNEFETPGINFIKAPDYYGTKAKIDPNKLNFNMNPFTTKYPRSSHSIFPKKGDIVDPNQFMFTETPFYNPSAGYFGGRGDQMFDPITTKYLPLKPYQTGEEIDLTQHMNTLIERINSPAFKDQVYAQHKNLHGYEPDWDWDAVVAKQIELITKGYEGGTYDPTVMTPLDQDYIDKVAKETRHYLFNPSGDTVMGGMSSQGDIEDIGNIYYNQEEFMENPEEGNLVALHEVSHRFNALEPTELTPYITQIFGEGDYSDKMGITQTNAAAEEERNYLKNMMRYGINYIPAVNDDYNEIYRPRSKNNYNWVGGREGGNSDRENYLTIPGEGHAFKTVLQEELKTLGIHDFNSGAFDDDALEKLYNMTAEQYESLDSATQEYLGGLGITEIIYPDGRNGKWDDESSVEDKKNDPERKENIFQYMNEFWGDKKEGNPFEVTDDFGQELTISKYGGQHDWALDLRPTTIASHGREVKNDDLYSNDRYSKSASKYKKMLPKYQEGEEWNPTDPNTPFTYEDLYGENWETVINDLKAGEQKVYPWQGSSLRNQTSTGKDPMYWNEDGTFKTADQLIMSTNKQFANFKPNRKTENSTELDIALQNSNRIKSDKIKEKVPFSTEEEGNVFRSWINDTYSEYAKEIDLDTEGSFDNTYIQEAWNTYGQDYLKLQQPDVPDFKVTSKEMNEYLNLIYTDLEGINSYGNSKRDIKEYNELHSTEFTDYQSVKDEMEGIKYMQRIYNIQTKYPAVTDISNLDLGSRNAIENWSDGAAQMFMALHLKDPNYSFGAWQFRNHSTSKAYADKIRKEVAFQHHDKLRQVVKSIMPWIVPETIEEAALMVGTFGVLKVASPWIMKNVFRMGDDVIKTAYNTQKVVYPKNFKDVISKYKGVTTASTSSYRKIYDPIKKKWVTSGGDIGKIKLDQYPNAVIIQENLSKYIIESAKRNAKLNEFYIKLLRDQPHIGTDDFATLILHHMNGSPKLGFGPQGPTLETLKHSYKLNIMKIIDEKAAIKLINDPKYIDKLLDQYLKGKKIDGINLVRTKSRSIYDRLFKSENPPINRIDKIDRTIEL